MNANSPLSTELEGIRLLNTRPLGRAEFLSRAIRECGGAAVELPLMDIEPVAEHDQACKQRFMDFDQFRKVIFISVNAVEHGMRWVDRYWPQLPLDQTYFAIGEATGAALDKANVESQSCVGMNTESLLARPELQSLEHEKILIVRGVGGRETLGQTLTERGAEVAYAECYRRRAASIPPNTLPQADSVNCLLANSGESATYLADLITCYSPRLDLWRSLPVIVPSARVEAVVRDCRMRPVLAENAGIPATLKALSALAIQDKHPQNCPN